MMTTTPTRYQRLHFRWLITAVLFAAPAVYAVDIGNTTEEVKAELGKPTSYIQIGDRQVLYYDRGHVELVGDAVVEVELVSQEEADEAKRLRAEAKARMKEERREKALARHAEGVNIRDRKLADSNFMSARASQRVAFWRSFKNRFPSVELGLEYEEALRELQLERQVGKQRSQEQARLRDLESRLLEAETRAARAEKLAYEEAARRDRNRYLAVSRPAIYTYNDNRPVCVDTDVVHSHNHLSGIIQPRRFAFEKRHPIKPTKKRGHIRPKGFHNAQIHNRALQSEFSSRTIFKARHTLGHRGSSTESTHHQ